jgi:hypothetical protein
VLYLLRANVVGPMSYGPFGLNGRARVAGGVCHSYGRRAGSAMPKK